MKKERIGAAVILVSALLISRAQAFDMERNFAEGTPELVYPHSETIDLNGKDTLEFKWLSYGSMSRGWFEFRLYKGYDANASTLIIKEKVRGNVMSLSVPAANFTDGEAYSWSVVHIRDDGIKSDRAFGSFRIEKR